MEKSVKKAKKITLFLYKHHFVRYLIVGGTTFVIDFGLLYMLHAHFAVKIAAATSVAYWVSITYNFMLNRYWTFDIHEKESLQKNIATYFFLLIFNYFFALIFVSAFSHIMNFMLAKALSVLLQMTWTFYLYKYFIFVDNTNKN